MRGQEFDSPDERTHDNGIGVRLKRCEQRQHMLGWQCQQTATSSMHGSVTCLTTSPPSKLPRSVSEVPSTMY